MGGGRDFLGNRLYTRIGGKYQRVRPYKKEYDELISKLTNEPLVRHEIREILHQFGFTDDQLGYIDEIKVMKDRQEMSVGLAKMAMAYGTDMLGNIRKDSEDIKGHLAHAHMSDSKEIHLNPDSFDGRQLDFQGDVDNGFHPKGYGFEMTVEHEYAHLLQRRLAGITRKDEIQMGKDRERLQELNKQIDDIDELLGPMWWKYLRNMTKINEMYGKKGITLAEIQKAEKANQELFLKVYNSNLGNNKKKIDGRLPLLRERDKLKWSIRKYDVSDKSQKVISSIFSKIGAPEPSDVAIQLTGRKDAYASRNWSEAHAECVADYMHNGKNASPISIAYIREMNKVFKATK